jgi:serine phosphatase RsbU (regulator of sigma subunit)
VLVRVAGAHPDELVARAVHCGSGVLAAEVAGSRLRVEEAGQEARELVVAEDDLPAAVARAAARACASRILLVPVAGTEDAIATLELYRADEPFSPDERSLAELAAAEIAAALELGRTALRGETPGERAHVSVELLAEALAAGSDESELAELVVRLAAEATGAVGCTLWRLEADAAPAFLAAHGLESPSPDPDAAAVRIRSALEPGPGQDGDRVPDEKGLVVVPLGEPPAGALELAFADGAGEGGAEALSALAARAAVGLRRTRRAHLIALALRRSQTIVAVISQAIARLSLSHTLETAVERISELTSSAHVGIYLREGEQLEAAASKGLHGSHTVLAERLLELALGPYRSRGFLFVPDLRRDPRLGDLEETLAQTGVRRALVVPLVVHDEVIGALAVFKQRPRAYRSGEEGLLIALSSQLAVAVQNARLHEQTKELGEGLERALAAERKAARQLRGLFQISHSFARSLSLEATLDAVARSMVELFGIDAAAILMPDARGDVLEARAVYVADDELRDAATTVLSRPQPLDADLVRRVLVEREPIVLTGTNGAVGGAEVLGPFLRKGSTAAVLPLATPGEVMGTLTLVSLDPARPLDTESLETAATVTAQAALAIENARLSQQQRDFAETMQRSLLPSELPAVPGLEIGHVYQSSARVDVGGDVYDFVELEDGRLAVCLGDVAGKGIQAAADMAMAKYAFRALARSTPDPSQLLALVNEVVLEELSLGKFLTMIYAVVDPRSGVVACANAGHPPARLVHPDGRVEGVESAGLALGVEAGQEYEEARVSADPGTSLVLYTDGVIEARREGELYGEARLDAFLSERAALGAQALAEALVADCRAFAGGDIPDDCAVVVLRMAS